jgi:hypothetical protein
MGQPWLVKPAPGSGPTCLTPWQHMRTRSFRLVSTRVSMMMLTRSYMATALSLSAAASLLSMLLLCALQLLSQVPPHQRERLGQQLTQGNWLPKLLDIFRVGGSGGCRPPQVVIPLGAHSRVALTG